tara:strand:- start:193 stop:615 length:423 start_codon:yes stop_codon:yes gene_type:complete
MSYKIVSKYIKDLSFEIFSAKSYFLLEKNIKNSGFVCDIKSQKIKEGIIQVNVTLRLVPKEEKPDKNIFVSVEMATIIQLDEKIDKNEIEKIVLINIPTDIYPEIRNTIIFLFERSGFKKINIDEKIDFLKLYEARKNQK